MAPPVLCAMYKIIHTVVIGVENKKPFNLMLLVIRLLYKSHRINFSNILPTRTIDSRLLYCQLKNIVLLKKTDIPFIYLICQLGC